MRQNPQRLAWTVLLAAFAVCCTLAIGAPLAVRWYADTAERPQIVRLEVNSGTVLVSRPGRDSPDGITRRLDDVPEGSQIVTDDISQGTVTFYAPDGLTALGALQAYGDVQAGLTLVRSPRFASSRQPNRMLIDLSSGRARVSVLAGSPRGVVMTLRTPQGLVILDQPGSYSVEISDGETQVTVREGVANVVGAGSLVTLDPKQRTVVAAGQPPAGVLPAERNLIRNGDFGAPVESAWQVFQNRAIEADSLGLVDQSVTDGRSAVHFVRLGVNWGETGIRQEINRDVRDYSNLRLHMAVRIVDHSLPICGSLGSECPIMAKIEYQDRNGKPHEWVQGFYVRSDVNSSSSPNRCVTCSSPSGPHTLVPPGTWYLYDSPNLIQLFSQVGAAPASITAISIYAQGHQYESLVSEAELLAQE